MGLEVAYWHWLVFGLVLIMLEVFTLSFTVLWFGLAALLVGVLLWLFPAIDLTWQLLIWAASSTVVTWAWFKFLKPVYVGRGQQAFSREAVLGQTGQIIKLPMGEQRGAMRFTIPLLGSSEWKIISEDETLEVGDRVIVTDILGNALVVRRK